ncbi:MAG: hypothetical protein AB7T22_13450, partial [Calditrichaceae bacterium]
MRFLLIIFFMIIISRLPSGAQTSVGKADFFVCENPRALIIKNRFQQNLSESELNSLSPFAPWRIIQENSLLSDQFTEAMKVSFKNQIYYILKNETGGIIYTGDVGKADIYRNCLMVQDTIEITRDRLISFSNQYSGDGFNRYLSGGERISRLFKYRSAYFSEVITARPEFGWIRLPGESGWRPFSNPQSVSNSIIPEPLRERIVAKFAQVNTTYNDYFTYFNKKRNRDKAIPRWVVVISNENISAELNPAEYTAPLSVSTKYLLNDLENILLGTGFGVSFDGGKVEV